MGQEPGNIADAAAGVQLNVNFVWTLIAAILVFLMQAGFAMLESGLTRAKNTVNIMMKNLMDFSIGTLAFWLIGFGLMFGTNVTGWIGLDGFMLSDYSDGWRSMDSRLLDVPGRFCSDSGDNRFRSDGRKNKVYWLSDL